MSGQMTTAQISTPLTGTPRQSARTQKPAVRTGPDASGSGAAPPASRPSPDGFATQHALMNRLFISQMLEFSGMFSARGHFGGGAGETQFASFLRDEYAARLSEKMDFLPHFERRIGGS